jgi:hypothetical protein
MLLRWELVDIRDEIAEYERKFRKWPRSGSVSKPYSVWYPLYYWGKPELVEQLKADKDAEEFYRWHQIKLVVKSK